MNNQQLEADWIGPQFSLTTGKSPSFPPDCDPLAAENARLRAQERAARRQAALWEAQAREAMRRKQDMLDLLGDELRNPLAAMTLSLARLQARAHGNPDRLCETMARQVERLGALVNELLDTSRACSSRAAFNQDPIEVPALIKAALNEVLPGDVEEPPEVVVEVEIPSPDLKIWGDWTLLRRALVEVLGNSIKFGRGRQPLHIGISAVPERGQAVIRVADDGAGVAPDKLKEIFDPFIQGFSPQTRSARGLGLGLTIVRRSVQLHGGEVFATSAGLGRGFEIELRLPQPL